MNSTMNREAFMRFLSAMDKQNKAKLLQNAVCYHEAVKLGDPQKLRVVYQSFLAAVQDGEQATGIQLISSPDDSYLCALNALSSQIDALLNKEYTTSFDTLQQANDWFMDKRNLILISVKIETRTSLGLFANHSHASKIIITYRLGTGKKLYRYGICQQEKTNLFKKGDSNQFAKEWETAHPGLECIFVQQTSNSRASAGSLAFGFGLDYVEHVKYFVTYRKQLTAE